MRMHLIKSKFTRVVVQSTDHTVSSGVLPCISPLREALNLDEVGRSLIICCVYLQVSLGTWQGFLLLVSGIKNCHELHVIQPQRV